MKKKIIGLALTCLIATQTCTAFGLPEWLKWSNIKSMGEELKNKALEAKNDPKKFCKENPGKVIGLAVGVLGTLGATATLCNKFFAKTSTKVNLPAILPASIPVSIPALMPTLINTAKPAMKPEAIKTITNTIITPSVFSRLKSALTSKPAIVIYAAAVLTGAVCLIAYLVNKKKENDRRKPFPKPLLIKQPFQVDYIEVGIDGIETPVTKIFETKEQKEDFEKTLTGEDQNILITEERKRELRLRQIDKDFIDARSKASKKIDYGTRAKKRKTRCNIIDLSKQTKKQIKEDKKREEDLRVLAAIVEEQRRERAEKNRQNILKEYPNLSGQDVEKFEKIKRQEALKNKAALERFKRDALF